MGDDDQLVAHGPWCCAALAASPNLGDGEEASGGLSELSVFKHDAFWIRQVGASLIFDRIPGELKTNATRAGRDTAYAACVKRALAGPPTRASAPLEEYLAQALFGRVGEPLLPKTGDRLITRQPHRWHTSCVGLGATRP